MSCLSLDQVYRYLEGEIDSGERKRLEEHLASCDACRDAVEVRRFLAEAASSLPDLEIPSDFSARVMAGIADARFSLRRWLAALAAGCVAIAVALGLAMVVTHQSIPGLLLGLNQYLWSNFKSLGLTLFKFFKVFLVFFKVFSQVLDQLADKLPILTTLLSPQLQIGLIILTLLFSLTLFVAVKRRLGVSEAKNRCEEKP